MLLRFLLGMIALVICVSLVSLLWSKFTIKPKPLVLAEVEKNVLSTSIGQEIANVLGVTQNTAPLNLQEVAVSAVNSVVTTVENKASETIAIQAINQLTKQFEKLSEIQKMQIRESICEPQQNNN